MTFYKYRKKKESKKRGGEREREILKSTSQEDAYHTKDVYATKHYLNASMQWII